MTGEKSSESLHNFNKTNVWLLGFWCFLPSLTWDVCCDTKAWMESGPVVIWRDKGRLVPLDMKVTVCCPLTKCYKLQKKLNLNAWERNSDLCWIRKPKLLFPLNLEPNSFDPFLFFRYRRASKRLSESRTLWSDSVGFLLFEQPSCYLSGQALISEPSLFGTSCSFTKAFFCCLCDSAAV